MLEVKDELIVFAEIGVALAGFLAIFLGFVTREGHLSEAETLEVLTVVSSGFATVFIALLPLVLFRLGLQSAIAWRISATTALLITIPLAVYFGLVRRWGRIKGEPALTRGPAGIIAGILGFPVLGSFLAVAVGFYPGFEAGLYLLGLIFGIATGTASFSLVVFGRFGRFG